MKNNENSRIFQIFQFCSILGVFHGNLRQLGDVVGLSRGVLEASWGVLDTSWRLLGGPSSRLGGALEASWGVLGASWGDLGASWGGLVVVLGRLGAHVFDFKGMWDHLGVPNRSKNG